MNQSTSTPVISEQLPGTPGKYLVIAELGRGGMATVFLAVAQGPGGFNKLQVVKRLRPALAVDPEFLQMFLDEARLSARINHPHVVQTNEVGFDGVYHYIAMEFLDGQALETILRRANEAKQPLPLPMHLRVIADALAGLHAAHELTDFDGNPLNVVHRDVSPHNMMVTYDGQVKVLDFGIAKAADSSSDTRTGIMKGKCAYMAAEQFGGSNVDRRADVFAIGVILWQALTGTRMWKGLSDAEVFQRLAQGDIRKPSSVKPDIPPELEAICMRALALLPGDRYPTAAEFQNDIEKYLGTLPQPGTARDVGKFISALFAETRAALKSTIEKEMRAKTAAGLSKGATAEVPVLWQLVPGSGPTATADFDGSQSGSLRLSTAAPSVAGGGQRKGRLAMLGAVAMIAFGVLVVAATGVYRKLPVAEAGPIPSALVVPIQASPPQVVVSVKATPSQAKIFLDDVPLPTNPASTTMVKDGASHRLRVEAPGYQRWLEFVVYDSSIVSSEVNLVPEPQRPSGAAVRGSTPPPAPPAPHAPPVREVVSDPPVPPPPPVAPPVTRPTKGGVDRGDPWEKDTH